LEHAAWFRYLLKPGVLGIPPLLVTAFYSNKTFGQYVTSNLPVVAQFLNAQAIWAIVCAAIYPGIVVALSQSVSQRVQSKGPNVENLLALLATLDGVVGAKLNRFADFVRNTQSLGKESAFCTITSPEKQIEELIRGVCTFFIATQPDKPRRLIRVVLAVLEEGKVTALPIFFPQDEPVRATIEELNEPRSAIQLAAKGKKILIVEDIAKEVKKREAKRRFAPSGNEDDQFGSLICYPIVYNHTGIVPYVISIHCEEEGFFKHEEAALYELFLQRFALRICLEYSLQQIKGALCE